MASVLSITSTFSSSQGTRSPASSASSTSLAGPAESVTKRELKQKPSSSLVPSHWQDTVREIGISECRQAGLALSHAFAADDLSKYLLDADDMAHYSDETRWDLHVLMMTGIVGTHCYKGIVATIGPDYDGVALWIPPGKDLDDWWTSFRSGLWKLTYKLSREGRRRYYNELMPILHDTKVEVMGDRENDCYHLNYLGTKPSARRKGYAGKLIESMIARADAEQRPMYLESSSLANNVFYQKFGFEIRKEIYLGKGKRDGSSSPSAPVRLTIMVREPRPVKDVK